DHRNNGTPPDLPEGEQFRDLVDWLERGLTRMEIEQIKSRGVSQLLGQLLVQLRGAAPPDLTAQADRVRAAWERILTEEAGVNTDVLLNTLEPYHSEIEHHFTIEGQKRFRGPMAWYLRFYTWMRYHGSSLRDRVRFPFVPRLGSGVETPAAWNLSAFTQ